MAAMLVWASPELSGWVEADRLRRVGMLTGLIVLGAVALLGGGWQWLGIVWLAGHLAWGARVVWILWHEPVRQSESVEEMEIGEGRGPPGDR